MLKKKTLTYFLVILSITLYILISESIDINVSEYFYETNDSGNGHFKENAFFTFLYRFGTWPALIISIGSTAIFFLSFFYLPLVKWRKFTALLSLSMLIGSLLIGHAIFKDLWGRPRPKQIIPFGGIYPYLPFYVPGFDLGEFPRRSFPCGHCTMGFYFFALMYGLKKEGYLFAAKWAAVLTWTLGLLLSLTRVAQGGHFVSDTLAAAFIMWSTAYLLSYLIYDLPSLRSRS